MMQSFIFGGKDMPKTPQELARMRQVAMAMAPQQTPQNVGQGIDAIGKALLYRSMTKKANAGEQAGIEQSNSMWDSLMGGQNQQQPASPAYSTPPVAGTMENARQQDRLSVPNYSGMDLKTGIKSTADALGIDPVELATVISYETGGTMDPTKAGPTTQWGQHKGLIQFGEPQAEKYGVNWNDPINSQLGPNGAVAKYLKDAGVQPGMGIMDVYSAINAGRVGRYGASDAQNGGAPGTVADKVNNQMAGHRKVAMSLLGGGQENAALAAQPGMAATSGVQVADASNSIMPNFDMNKAMQLYNDPFLPEGKKAVLGAMIKQQQAQQQAQYEMQLKQNDPAYKLDLQTKQINLNKLQNPEKFRTLTPDEAKQMNLDPTATWQVGADNKISKAADGAGSDWAKLDDGTLYNQKTGETKNVGQKAQPGQFRFSGNSVDAQALNGLMDSGSLTAEQAQQIAAGKTITGPEGQIIFMTPQGIFGGQAGQQPKPIVQFQQPEQQQGIDIFGGQQPQQGAIQPVQPVVQPEQPIVQPEQKVVQPQTNSGMIQLTTPKVTEAEKQSANFADKMIESGAIIDEMGMEGTSTFDNVMSSIPLAGDYLTSSKFKDIEQAKRQFINSQLRKESGAAIGKDEYDSADKQYFPQPNDGPDVLEQKRISRQRAIEGMIRSAGSTYKPPSIKKAKQEEIPPAPDGLDPSVWKHMTPEERKLW